MIVAVLVRRRFQAAAFGLAAACVALAAAFVLQVPAQRAEAATTVQLPPARTAALVAATSASAARMGAIGEEARLINASLPFSAAAVQASRPFGLQEDGLDYGRALLCLTQAVYYEAGFEPADGRRAVAQVVLNRLRHPAFPKSVCGVVYQGSRSAVCQFSFVCDGSLYRAPARDAWAEARRIAEAALAGYVERSVGAATHYHADYVAPRWAPMLTKITQIGAHIFYRWPGAWGQQTMFTGRYVGEPNDPLALRPPRLVAAPGQPVGTDQAQAGAVADGTVLKRAPNDVGGLLDASKGWTLSIPAPQEVSSASSRALAQQQAARPSSPAETVVAAASSDLASR